MKEGIDYSQNFRVCFSQADKEGCTNGNMSHLVTNGATRSREKGKGRAMWKKRWRKKKEMDKGWKKKNATKRNSVLVPVTLAITNTFRGSCCGAPDPIQHPNSTARPKPTDALTPSAHPPRPLLLSPLSCLFTRNVPLASLLFSPSHRNAVYTLSMNNANLSVSPTNAPIPLLL